VLTPADVEVEELVLRDHADGSRGEGVKRCPVTIDRCGVGSSAAHVVEVYRASGVDVLHEVSVDHNLPCLLVHSVLGFAEVEIVALSDQTHTQSPVSHSD
jgi:hypothetical protein